MKSAQSFRTIYPEVHADRAIAKVVDADVWTASACGAKDPKAKKEEGKGGGKPQFRQGRCHSWDKTGSCSRGKQCPWQGSHGSKHKEPRSSDRDSDDKDGAGPAKFQWSQRKK